MAVTLQQIAEKAGVSRGTVDRALNNRGRIRPEVADSIKKIAEEMGYRPNLAGRAMAIARKGLRIGIIVQSSETPFIEDVIRGAAAAKSEVEALGGTLDIHKITGMDAGAVVEAMQELRARKFNAIAVMPSDDHLLRRMIDRFAEEYKIPVVTFNTDLENTKRICFVGQDAIRSGKTAAGLLSEVTGGSGKVCIVTGNENNKTLSDRQFGFQEEMRENFPAIEVLKPRNTYDDNWVAERIMDELTEEHPDLAGVYVTGHGVQGICESLKKKGLQHKIKVVANDLLKDNISCLKDGSINFLISQDPHAQGFEPTMILQRLIFEGISPETEYRYTDIVIKTKYNL